MEYPITFFFINTRSGTQWLHHSFLKNKQNKDLFSDECPNSARPESKYFRTFKKNTEENSSQIELIKKTIRENKKYIQSSAIGTWNIPALVEEFPGQCNIVHVIRNPFDNIFSQFRISNKHFFNAEQNVCIDKNSNFKQLKHKKEWENYTREQRAIVYWSELHLYAKETVKKYNLNCLTLKFEEMFSEESAKKLLEHCELNEDNIDFGTLETKFDRNKAQLVKKEDLDFSFLKTKQFQDIAKQIKKYGYEIPD